MSCGVRHAANANKAKKSIIGFLIISLVIYDEQLVYSFIRLLLLNNLYEFSLHFHGG